MLAPDIRTPLSVEDYLAGEIDSPVRHEYVGGEIYARAGASDRHNRIAINLTSRLDAHLAGDACAVFMSGMKVRVAPTVFYYPDVVVACDPPGADPYVRVDPRLVVEVTSPSTERVDRHEKRLAYTQLEGLVEYVVIAQDRLGIDVFRRQSDGTWAWERLTRREDELALASVGVRLRLADVYRGVSLP